MLILTQREFLNPRSLFPQNSLDTHSHGSISLARISSERPIATLPANDSATTIKITEHPRLRLVGHGRLFFPASIVCAYHITLPRLAEISAVPLVRHDFYSDRLRNKRRQFF